MALGVAGSEGVAGADFFWALGSGIATTSDVGRFQLALGVGAWALGWPAATGECRA